MIETVLDTLLCAKKLLCLRFRRRAKLRLGLVHWRCGLVGYYSVRKRDEGVAVKSGAFVKKMFRLLAFQSPFISLIFTHKSDRQSPAFLALAVLV